MHRVIAMLLLAAEAVRSQTCTPEGQQVISTVAGDGSMGTADGAGAAARAGNFGAKKTRTLSDLIMSPLSPVEISTQLLSRSRR